MQASPWRGRRIEVAEYQSRLSLASRAALALIDIVPFCDIVPRDKEIEQ
jgi:hypothetical protein